VMLAANCMRASIRLLSVSMNEFLPFSLR
jgi:hypothetical protein